MLGRWGPISYPSGAEGAAARGGSDEGKGGARGAARSPAARRGPCSKPLRPSRVRTLQLAAAGALAVLAVRPVAPLERALDWAVAPARGLVELAGPVGWLQSRDVLAATPEHDAQLEDERAEQARLEVAVRRMAEPETLTPQAGRVRAEVVRRPDGELDQLLVRVEDPSVVGEDLPVVAGDVFVGRLDVAATRADRSLPPDQFLVHLVTGADFRVGARTLRGDGRMVVGGLAGLPGLRLAVHNPEDRGRTGGPVLVDEPASTLGGLANGFRLGELVREAPDPEAPERRVLGLAPDLDYETGLHQVLVLLPGDGPAPLQRQHVPLAQDGRWLPARLPVRGELSATREGRPLALGRIQGVRDGAALASGTRLVGRVLRAGVAESDVGMLGDRGLTVPALALLEGAEGPRVHVLGRLTCLDRRGATVRLRWPASLPLDPSRFPGGAVRARVWTGSGEALVPRGLLLGDTRLPTGPGPHVLELTLPDDGEEPSGLVVRLAEEVAR